MGIRIEGKKVNNNYVLNNLTKGKQRRRKKVKNKEGVILNDDKEEYFEEQLSTGKLDLPSHEIDEEQASEDESNEIQSYEELVELNEGIRQTKKVSGQDLILPAMIKNLGEW